MPELFHKPVLLKEVLAVMAIHSTGRYGDGTVGGAGHAASDPGGKFADWMVVWMRSRWRRAAGGKSASCRVCGQV